MEIVKRARGGYEIVSKSFGGERKTGPERKLADRATSKRDWKDELEEESARRRTYSICQLNRLSIWSHYTDCFWEYYISPSSPLLLVLVPYPLDSRLLRAPSPYLSTDPTRVRAIGYTEFARLVGDILIDRCKKLVSCQTLERLFPALYPSFDRVEIN